MENAFSSSLWHIPSDVQKAPLDWLCGRADNFVQEMHGKFL